MNNNIKIRIIKSADIIIENKYPIRDIAQILGYGKSTIHNDLRVKLKNIDVKRYYQVDQILNNHLQTRHIKGGEATRIKYLKQK